MKILGIKKCPECGALYGADDKFCPKCGRDLISMTFKQITFKQWLKPLAVISLIIIIFAVIMIGVSSSSRGDIGGLVVGIVSLLYIAVIVGMWGLGFLIKYLVKRKLYWIANTISIGGLVISSILLLKLRIPNLSFFTFIIFLGWLIIAVIYFIVSLVLISKAKINKVK